MSYKIEQKIGNNIYIYKVTSYWDTEKKQARQKREYVGKKDVESGKTITPNKSNRPRLAKDHGAVYLLEKIASQTGISKILKDVFKKDYISILGLSYFLISDGEPLYLFPTWLETTDLPDTNFLSSQKISKLLNFLGESDVARHNLLKKWANKNKKSKTIVLDITSLSSYSRNIDYVEWGYNRDNESLPQINLGVVYSESNHLPIYYKVYPGSITDVTTLKNIVKHLDELKIRNSLFVLDRGFYSSSNIKELKDSKIDFVVAMPFTLKSLEILFNKNKDKLNSPSSVFTFKDTIYHHVSSKIKISGTNDILHIYNNPQHRNDESISFYKKLLEIESIVSKKEFKDEEELVSYINTNCRGMSKYFKISFDKGKALLERKVSAIEDKISKMGIMFLLTSSKKQYDEILSLYRDKDQIEKLFDRLKNEIDGNRIRVHSQQTMEGLLFIKFISLIIFSELENKMKASKLDKTYSVKKLLREMKKIKKVQMTNGKSYLTEISKTQKDILKAFGLEPQHLQT